MPRRKTRPRWVPPPTQAIISSTGITPVVHREVSTDEKNAAIRRLFVTVNHPTPADSPADIQVLERFLTALRDGWRFTSLNMRGPLWVQVAMSCLADACQRGHHVRRCARCEAWMFVRDKRRKYCTTPACEQARVRVRRAGWRQREHQKNTTARHRVTTSRRKKPR